MKYILPILICATFAFQGLAQQLKANRFLRGMVRALVGTQLLVARNKISLEEFNQIILSKDCTKADFSVPGHGLYLEQINYPENSLEEILF